MATIQPYGAFVSLDQDLNGLLHISQISHDRISSVEQVLQVGQKLKVRVLSPSMSGFDRALVWQLRSRQGQPVEQRIRIYRLARRIASQPDRTVDAPTELVFTEMSPALDFRRFAQSA